MNNNHLAKTTTIQIAGKLLSTILGLIATLQLLRLLGPEQLGWYTVASGYLQFIGIAGDFGFMLVTSTMLSEPAFDKTKVFNTVFTWRLITAFILQGVAPFVFFLFGHPEPIPSAVAILSISFFAVQLNQIFSGYFQAHLKNHIPIIGEVLARLALLAGIFGLRFYNGTAFLPLVTTITISSVLNTLYLFIRHGWFRLAIDRTISRALFIKTWPTALCIIFNAVYLQGDKVILPLYEKSARLIGLYGAAYRVIDIITQIVAMLMATMLPLLSFHWSRKNKQEFENYVQLSLDVMALVVMPMVGGLVALGTPIMHFIDPTYASGGPILSWLALAIIGIGLGNIFGHTALALNRQREAAYVFAGVALISSIGYFMLIPRLSVWGAVIVSVGAEILAGLALAALTWRFSTFFPSLRTVGKIFISSALMAAFVYRLPITLLPIRILAGALLYCCFLSIWGIITPQTTRELFKTFSQKNSPSDRGAGG